MTSTSRGLIRPFGWGVYSVWRRHFAVYCKTWLVNFLPPITEPIMYLIAFGYGLGALMPAIELNGREIAYMAFLAPAMIAVGTLFQGFFEAAFGSFVRLQYQRTWHALLTAPISYTEIYLGELVWAATRGAIAGTVTGLVAVALGLMPFTTLLLLLPIIVLGSLMFASMGIIVSGIVQTVDQINVPIFVLIIPMFSLCGTFFPRENLPALLRAVADYLPLAPYVDLLRMPLGQPVFWPWNVGLIAFYSAAATAAGWWIMRRRIFR